MERLTEKHFGNEGYYMKCSEFCANDDEMCGGCPELDKIVNRLAAYEDTGLEPEEIVELALKAATLETIEAMYEGLGRPEHLRSLVEAEKDGRLVVLDEPVRPLVWGDDTHDRVLCPRCLCDLMGGFEFAPSCETQMFQCPHCGQPIDATKALPLEESEAEAALAGERKDGEG